MYLPWEGIIVEVYTIGIYECWAQAINQDLDFIDLKLTDNIVMVTLKRVGFESQPLQKHNCCKHAVE